jgi:hypothetical protein
MIPKSVCPLWLADIPSGPMPESTAISRQLHHVRGHDPAPNIETLDMSPSGSDIYFQQRQLQLSCLGLRALKIIDRLCDAAGWLFTQD